MQQTSGNVFLGHLGEQGSTRSRECPQIPFRILVDNQSKLCATSNMKLFVTKNSIVCRRVSSPPFLKISHPPTLPTNRSSQVFLINRNVTVKLSSMNTIHVKQEHNVGFSIFKFTLKYMLGNVYGNEIHVS